MVVCKTASDTACSKTLCVPTTGLCKVTAATALCDDGKACTHADACKDGWCAGSAKTCSDGDPCTTDNCQEPQGCVSLPLSASACDDGNACTGDTCAPGQGCTHSYLNTTCIDGNPCTAADKCKDGVCLGVPSQCDDANPCTDDSCTASSGCQHKANGVACSDADACTDKDVCANGTCAGKSVVCDDGNACSDDFCDKKAGCSANPNGAPCDDGNACTVKDACKAGVCGGYLQCNDNNLCTTDTCDKGSCAYLPNAFECSDGNACTTGDTCGGGKCAGSGKLDCDDKNLCTLDNCDAVAGCAHAATGQACDDGSACTSNDACANGSCSGKKMTCDDGKACTDDACDPAKGCTATDNVNPCSDGNACTQNDACALGKCAAGKAVSCDDGDFCTSDVCDTVSGKCSAAPNPKACDDGKLCTDDACDGKLGCQHTYNKTKCDDGNACTGGDTCSFGICLSGPAANCGDSNLCTDDSCDSKLGCVFAPNAKPCDDGNGCTQKDTCKAGNCAGTISCDDANPCTDDSCNFAKAACDNLSNANDCDDGDKCTATSGCQQGKCQGLTSKDCDDFNACTDNACDKDKGCHYPNNALPCDAQTCTGEDACMAGSCKTSGKPLYAQQVYADIATSDLVADLIATDDGAIGVGYAQTQDKLTASKSQAWRWGRGGSLLWSKKLNVDLSGTLLDGVVQLPDGTYAAVGTWDNALGQDNDQALVVRFDGEGKQLSRFTFGFKTDPGNGKTPEILDDRGVAIVLSPLTPTEMYVCGWGSTCGTGCNEDVWVARFKTDGSLMAVATHGDPFFAHQHVYACAATGDGKFLLSVGDSDGASPDAKGQPDGEVVVWSLPGLNKVKVHRLGTGYYDFLFAATTASDGTVYVGGAWPITGKYARWFLHFDQAGALLWEKNFPNTIGHSVSAMVALPDGGVVGTGPWGTNGSAQQGFAHRLDWTGNDVKLQLLPVAQTNRRFDSAVRDKAGAIWVGGSEFVANTFDALVTRIDPWLNTQCTTPCGNLQWASCNDGNLCTTDYCSGACLHSAFGGPCDDANACSANDKCANDVCYGTAIVCDDQNACTQDSCEAKGGCKHVAYPEGYVCATGKKCVVGVCN